VIILRKAAGSIIARLPFDELGEWKDEIDRSVERDIERLEADEDADEDFLISLRNGDIDYDAIFERAATAYVTAFDGSASRELGSALSLRFHHIDGGDIFASMPIAIASRLLRVLDSPAEEVATRDWERLLYEKLENCEGIQQAIFAHLAEATDVFYPG
jgi:hypothetical protein